MKRNDLPSLAVSEPRGHVEIGVTLAREIFEKRALSKFLAVNEAELAAMLALAAERGIEVGRKGAA